MIQWVKASIFSSGHELTVLGSSPCQSDSLLYEGLLLRLPLEGLQWSLWGLSHLCGCLLPSASKPWQTPGHRAGGWVANSNSSKPRVTLAPRTVISGHTWPHPGLSALGTPNHRHAHTHRHAHSPPTSVSKRHWPQPRAQGTGPPCHLLGGALPQAPAPTQLAHNPPFSDQPQRAAPHRREGEPPAPSPRCSVADPLAGRTQTPRRCRLSRPPARLQQARTSPSLEGGTPAEPGGRTAWTATASTGGWAHTQGHSVAEWITGQAGPVSPSAHAGPLTA